MGCERIREKLSEHAEGLLPKDEAARIEEHLASCSECREAYDDLLKTLSHLRNLEEVSPPEWFTAKVMAKVKDEAADRQRGWKAFFRPLPVKLPLGAVATVLIAIAALYLYQANRSATTILPAGRPEVKVQPFRQDKGAEERRRPGEQFANEPAPSRREAKRKEVPAPLQQEMPRAKPLKDAEQGLTSTLSEAGREGSAGKPQQVPQAELKERSTGGGEDRMLLKGSPGAVGAVAPASPAPLPMSREEKKEAVGYFTSPARRLVLSVGSIARAEEDLSKLLSRNGGRIVDEKSFDGRKVLACEIDAAKMPEMREELRKIGTVLGKELPVVTGGGRVRFAIELRENRQP